MDLWRQGVIVDLTLPAGSLVLGILVGTQLGTWSAARGTLPAKAVEALAMLFDCLPPYLAGYLALLAAGASVAGLILNVVLVEFVFALPGFFKYTWREFGKAPGLPQAIDYQMLQAIAVWAAVVIALFSLLADLALHRLDPRVRASGPVG